MRLFVPMARSAEEAAAVYSAIKAHLRENLGARFSSRKVRSLRWSHEGSKHEAEVGKPTSFNGEIVIAILYEPKRNLYHVCTPNRGFLRDMSILIGGHSAHVVSDFAKGGMALSGWWSGRDSGCPFCVARNQELPNVGEKIRFLSEDRAGKVGIVVESFSSNKDKLRPREFLVEMEGDLPDYQQTVNAETDLFERLPGTPVPAWAPPISLTEAEELDHLIIGLCDESSYNEDGSFSMQFFYALIRHVWRRRLPIDPEEIWKLIEAHGAPSRWRNRLIRLYSEGRDLLIHIVGRKPIKKKRVRPLSV